MVRGYTGRIEPGREDDIHRMRANADPPTMYLARKTTAQTATWLAGALAHEV